MNQRHLTEYRYEKLTWPEINDAVAAGKIPIVPIGAVEQHGPHLPLDVDMLLSTSVALAAGKRIADKVLVLPSVSYGYTGHVMDFPGTINIHYQHFIDHVLDICRSLAYHGFKKIFLLNGHGSNMPNLDLVARRCNLETDAECAFTSWWLFLTVDKEFLPRWRESQFPGGCAHACELETSVYMHLAPEDVRMDKITSGAISFNEENSPYRYVDLFGAGPVHVTSWTSSYSDTGVLGAAELATPEKGKQAFEEAVKQLCSFINEWRAAPTPTRKQNHHPPSTMPMPWNQSNSLKRRD
jgi:creatinine amidohydrolase